MVAAVTSHIWGTYEGVGIEPGRVGGEAGVHTLIMQCMQPPSLTFSISISHTHIYKTRHTPKNKSLTHPHIYIIHDTPPQKKQQPKPLETLIFELEGARVVALPAGPHHLVCLVGTGAAEVGLLLTKAQALGEYMREAFRQVPAL